MPPFSGEGVCLSFTVGKKKVTHESVEEVWMKHVDKSRGNLKISVIIEQYVYLDSDLEEQKGKFVLPIT